MDLSKLNVVELANEGAVLELLHPSTGEVLTDEKKESKVFFLRLLGSDSDTYRNAIKRRFESNNKNKNKKLDLDAAQRKAAELLAKCTIDCYMLEDGKAIECNLSEMTRVYLKYPWIREQAEEFMADRSNLIES